MKARPPAVLDRMVSALTPPAAREATLGDLWERYRSPLQYSWEALTVLPFVIASQARRAAYFPMLGLQAFILFACLGGFVPDPSVPPMWARAAVPTLLAFAGLMLRDIYRSSDERSIGRAFVDVLTVAGCILASQALLAASGWLLHPSIAVLATLALPILWVLRFGQGVESGSRLEREAAASAEELAGDYARFQRGVRIRNVAEIAALLAIIAGSAYFLLRFNPAVAPMGWAFLPGFALLVAYLAVRGAAQRIPERVGFAPLRTLYQQELARQHRLRRLMWWWWFGPLFAGLITNLIVRGFASGDPILAALGVALALLLGLCIARLNRSRGRDVEAKISRLAALSERGIAL